MDSLKTIKYEINLSVTRICNGPLSFKFIGLQIKLINQLGQLKENNQKQ